jgi:hypothetical protein
MVTGRPGGLTTSTASGPRWAMRSIIRPASTRSPTRQRQTNPHIVIAPYCRTPPPTIGMVAPTVDPCRGDHGITKACILTTCLSFVE